MTDSHKITLEEFAGIFGDEAPMEAYALLLSAPGKMTVGEVRDRLRQMADARAALAAAPQPTPETMAWAVIGEDGAIDLDQLHRVRRVIEPLGPGESIARVAIRVVEGGDDAT